MRMTIDSGVLLNIADAIRKVEGSDEKIKVTDYADRIEALEEIGGGSALSDNIYVADFSPFTPTNKIHIEHNLGKTPYFVGIFAGEIDGTPSYWIESFIIMPDGTTYVTARFTSNDGAHSKKNAKETIITITDNECTIDLSTALYISKGMFKDTDYTIIVVS